MWLADRTPLQRRLLAFGAGLVSALGFAPIEAWPLTIVGLAALLLLLGPVHRMRTALATGWWFGLGHFLLGQYWIAHAFQFQANMPPWLGWVAVLLLSMLMAIYPAAASGLSWRIGRGRLVWQVAALAPAWMLTEWLRGYVFGGFPWNPLGVTWLPLIGVAQMAAVVGALGLSGLMIAAGGALALALSHQQKLAGRIVGGLAAAGIAGTVLMGDPAPLTNTRLHIVQANIGQDEKWRPDVEERNLRQYEALSRAAIAKFGPGLVLWPEAAVPAILDEEPELQTRLGRIVGPGGLLLTGAPKAIRDRAGDAIAARNSLFVVAPTGHWIDRYDKAELVPFGEYLPMRTILTAIGISRLAPGDLDFWPGPGARTLHLPGFPPVGPLICYEVVFSGHAADRLDRPAWLLNASNDAWFSDGGAWMHLAQARLRAIEEGLPVARATPTGVSAIIDPRGRILATLGRDRQGVLTTMLPAPLAATPFGRAGEGLPVGLAVLITGLVVIIARR